MCYWLIYAMLRFYLVSSFFLSTRFTIFDFDKEDPVFDSLVRWRVS